MAMGKLGGFMGLTKPFETVWADGRKVVVFPNGKVTDQATGMLVRRGEGINDFEDIPQVEIINSGSSLQDKQVIQPNKNSFDMQVFLIFIIAIIALVIIAGIIMKALKDGSK